MLNGEIIRRSERKNERIRIVTSVDTPNHKVATETYHEVGLGIEGQWFLLPKSGAENLAESVYYTSVDRYEGANRTGGIVASWATADPMGFENGLGTLSFSEKMSVQDVPIVPRTGLFIVPGKSTSPSSQNGKRYVDSDLFAVKGQSFMGTITEIHSDSGFVLAAKSGFQVPDGQMREHPFVNRMNGLEGENGGVSVSGSVDGELILFTPQNDADQMGQSYSLAGRIEMPYKEVYGVARKDSLAFVANGYGGVQVIDISNILAPYHTGYIKPNGFARDVAVYGRFAVIAASHEGVVIADIEDPSMPVIAVVDTLGIANRLFIEGHRLYVTDMAGDGRVSRLNVFDLKDPWNPRFERAFDIHSERKDQVSDGVFDVHVSGGKAFVTVHYSDQEDRPVRSVVQIIDLERAPDRTADCSIPVIVHDNADDKDFAPRSIMVADGAINAAGAMKGIVRVELSAMTVLSHVPEEGGQDISTMLEKVSIQLSQRVKGYDTGAVNPADLVRVTGTDPDAVSGDDSLISSMAEEITDLFDIGFATDGQDRILGDTLELRLKAGKEL